jgi:hypothetical protein
MTLVDWRSILMGLFKVTACWYETVTIEAEDDADEES